jgi:hypothetical protein
MMIHETLAAAHSHRYFACMHACKWVVEGPTAIAFQVFQSIMASKPNDIFKSWGKSLAKEKRKGCQ